MKYTKDNPKIVVEYYLFQGKDTFTGVVKDIRNTIAYYVNGKYHRTDGPAIEYHNGNKSWYLNGKKHREDGPAIEGVDGNKSWYFNGDHYGWNNDFTNESWIRSIQLNFLK